MKRLKEITVATLRRIFCAVLRRKQGGRRFIVPVNGRPVAKIEPIQALDMRSRTIARARLFQRLAAQHSMDAARWKRHTLYDR